jgi:putative MATE family efflux protein
MKQIDFANGRVSTSILRASLPMLAAQFLNLLYNIVDRIYTARIPSIGTTALGAVGICFPLIVIVSAFANMYGSGGSPLFAIERGKQNDAEAENIMRTSYTLLTITAIMLTILCIIFCKPILVLFGASETALIYAIPYIRIYLLGTFPSMVATGMNPFINAQGYASNGMVSVMIGAIANIILDPIFIFALGLGVRGAAIATIISQTLSAIYVLRFLYKHSLLKLRLLTLEEFKVCGKRAKKIVSLGLASFIMYLTNSLVSAFCNRVLASTGGDLYVSIMTIISSIRQMIETPIYAITEGSSPLISYNYGAKKPDRVFRFGCLMAIMAAIYAGLMWIVIILAPGMLISIFSSDQTILADAIPALKLYFNAFIFMVFQYAGQTMFKSLGKNKQAIFFSLLRKAIIVIPLTVLLPYAFHLGTNGVFMAEPISNVVGGSICFITMLLTVLPELKAMKEEA